MTSRRIVVLAIATVALGGCAHKKRAKFAPPPPPGTFRPGYAETGVASWYGNPYHGRAAANGEIYDMDKMTAAHRTMPFNTWVRVTDLDNSKSTEVRITDRGPFIEGRVIDLSRAAARELEMIGPGTARVRVEIIRSPEGVAMGVYGVQVGAFRDRANADRVRGDMERLYGGARLLPRPGNPPVWRVLVGAESTEEGANSLAEKIRRNSIQKNTCFVVRIDTI